MIVDQNCDQAIKHIKIKSFGTLKMYVYNIILFSYLFFLEKRRKEWSHFVATSLRLGKRLEEADAVTSTLCSIEATR